jgi:hypothetical protein
MYWFLSVTSNLGVTINVLKILLRISYNLSFYLRVILVTFGIILRSRIRLKSSLILIRLNFLLFSNNKSFSDLFIRLNNFLVNLIFSRIIFLFSKLSWKVIKLAHKLIISITKSIEFLFHNNLHKIKELLNRSKIRNKFILIINFYFCEAFNTFFILSDLRRLS